MERFFFWPNNLPTIKSLSVNAEARFAVSLAEILYENIPLTEMTFQSQGSTCMFIAFTGSTSYVRICVACLRLTTLPRRVVNAGCPKKVHIYEIRYFCSENRSISKVGVICQTSPQLRF